MFHHESAKYIEQIAKQNTTMRNDSMLFPQPLPFLLMVKAAIDQTKRMHIDGSRIETISENIIAPDRQHDDQRNDRIAARFESLPPRRKAEKGGERVAATVTISEMAK